MEGPEFEPFQLPENEVAAIQRKRAYAYLQLTSIAEDVIGQDAMLCEAIAGLHKEQRVVFLRVAAYHAAVMESGRTEEEKFQPVAPGQDQRDPVDEESKAELMSVLIPLKEGYLEIAKTCAQHLYVALHSPGPEDQQ